MELLHLYTLKDKVLLHELHKEMANPPTFYSLRQYAFLIRRQNPWLKCLKRNSLRLLAVSAFGTGAVNI